MAVVDINKNFLYYPVRPAYGRLTVRDPYPYFYEGVSVPWHNCVKHGGINQGIKNNIKSQY